jgi:hypothetical protein
MCDTRPQRARESAVGRPRWGLLYAATLPQLAGLVAVEAVHSPAAVRIALRCVLALGMFAAMFVWLRANRPAFDLQNWCDCAGQQMTIRVVDARRPQPVAPPPDRVVAVPDWIEAEYEVSAR